MVILVVGEIGKRKKMMKLLVKMVLMVGEGKEIGGGFD